MGVHVYVHEGGVGTQLSYSWVFKVSKELSCFLSDWSPGASSPDLKVVSRSRKREREGEWEGRSTGSVYHPHCPSSRPLTPLLCPSPDLGQAYQSCLLSFSSPWPALSGQSCFPLQPYTILSNSLFFFRACGLVTMARLLGPFGDVGEIFFFQGEAALG